MRIVGGDTKVVERGHADGMYITPPASAGATRARRSRPPAPGRPDPALRARSPRTAPRSCSPAASSSSTPTIVSDTRSLWPAVDAILGPGVRQLRDATRGGVASVLNELARDSGVAMLVAGGGGPGRARGRRRLRAARHRPDVRRQRGRLRGDRRARLRGRPGFADIGEVKTEPPGMVLVETSFGGKRVMDELVGDPLPRIC